MDSVCRGKNDCSTESKLHAHIAHSSDCCHFAMNRKLVGTARNAQFECEATSASNKTKSQNDGWLYPSKLHVDSIAIMMYQPGLGKVSGLHSKYRSEKYTITLSRSWLSPTGGGEGWGQCTCSSYINAHGYTGTCEAEERQELTKSLV